MAEKMQTTEFGDLIEDLSDPSDIDDHVLVIDGDPYYIDDLHFCAECALAFVKDERIEDSVGDMLCPDCNDTAIADQIYQDELWQDFRASR